MHTYQWEADTNTISYWFDASLADTSILTTSDPTQSMGRMWIHPTNTAADDDEVEFDEVYVFDKTVGQYIVD